jgi:hypothetical protein
MLVEFRNQVAQKASSTTTNHDLRAIKALFREAKRDGYIAEAPSELVDTVRKSFDDKRRPARSVSQPEQPFCGSAGAGRAERKGAPSLEQRKGPE